MHLAGRLRGSLGSLLQRRLCVLLLQALLLLQLLLLQLQLQLMLLLSILQRRTHRTQSTPPEMGAKVAQGESWLWHHRLPPYDKVSL